MIKEINTFLLVTRYGSFSKTAIHLGITPSAISTQIKNLENHLGIQLFTRSAHSIALTDAGKQIIDHAKNLIQVYDELRYASDAEIYLGKIKLGAINTIQTGILPMSLKLFQQNIKFVDMKIIPGISKQLISALIAKEIDLAITVKPNYLLPKDISVETLFYEPFMLIYTDETKITNYSEIIKNNPFIQYDKDSIDGKQVSQFLLRNQLDHQVIYELDEIDAIVQMVKLGIGVSIIPWAGLLVNSLPNGIKHIKLEMDNFRREIVLIEHYSSKGLKSHQIFKACLEEVIQTITYNEV
ncbi:LysR family transcriptional regulator [Acinetobacter sp. ESL0695]|uniref:LysR family transcriptional regulator n=1 Tax=Acinetobacter sp. ESL0695 TaxID=2983215 RepID=UPI0023F29BA0|nr:LysR family transcriptional regulator [Acinetobacter sp. ESL0695]WEV49072.1 LysR family transcriptional regulator [Acinetobacter sp. ESL0695]